MKKCNEFKIKYSPIIGKAIAGKVRKGKFVSEKYDVTDDVVNVAAKVLLSKNISFVFNYRNKKMILKVEEYKED